MAVNFNHCNSISSVGSGLGYETIDVPFFLSPTDSNLGLNHVRGGGLIDSNLGLGQHGINHRVKEVMKTYVSPNRVQVHSVIDYAPVQNRPVFFPPKEVAAVTEVVKTTRFLTSTSIMRRVFALSTRVTNQGIFPTRGVCIQAQPVVRNQPNQVMNFVRPENPSMNQEAFNIFNHNNHVNVNVKRETVFYPTSVYSYEPPSYNQGLNFDQTAIILRNLDNLNKSNNSMNKERGPSFDSIIAFDDGCNQVRLFSPQRNQERCHSTLEEVSDENDYPLGYDGRTHSLPGYPEGVYGCPKCLETFYTSQTFAAHIQTHYKQESTEERRRRMAAKCRRRNLRLVRTSHGLTALPKSSKGITKGCNMRRKNDIAVKIENVEKVRQGLGLNTPPVAAKKGPLHVVMIKEEPISFS